MAGITCPNDGTPMEADGFDSYNRAPKVHNHVCSTCGYSEIH